ncbi:uncharacterized protein LOC127860306 isoform X2 [Dreissena polymorpha]|uniref:uncharacterized protein LOC127860306 isoform X2 n=1 Tax=Dreissena polymorpha TaxID=45954 RepID=UPI0022643190|nr:uncharacterized protein LOC127860306 isoform X2 [Dreissena polymorpha]
MASQADASSVTSPEIKRKKRSINFSNTEILKFEELVKDEKTFSILTNKFSNTVNNKMKKDMWTKIAEVISAQGIAVRTADECSNKWQNLKRESKAAVTSEKLERRKTGRGTLTAVADEQKVRIAEMYKDSASFNGIIGGLDSDEADGRHFLSNTTVAPAVGTVGQTEQSRNNYLI